MTPARPRARVAIIEVRDVRKEFPTKGGPPVKAVDGVTLSIPEGEIFGLLGPNGAGKTTLLSILITLQKPTSGTATIAGLDVLKEPLAVRKVVGMVFQEPSLDTILTGRENLDLHARLYGVPRAKVKPRIAELLKLVDLEARADHLVKTYSGGMKRRMEIARGLLHWPKVLFLDEPTLGLDPQTREHIWAYIERMVQEERTTVVLTTHYMDEADRLCDRIGIIDHGRIVALDTPEGLKGALGGDVVRLRMRSAPDAKAFEGLPFVRKAEVQGLDVVLTIEGASRHLPALLAEADGVEQVELRSPTLNDVFLAHTGRGIRDEVRTVEGSGFMDNYASANVGR
jgi:ABC-2 type transport system ATP-binding protein